MSEKCKKYTTMTLIIPALSLCHKHNSEEFQTCRQGRTKKSSPVASLLSGKVWNAERGAVTGGEPLFTHWVHAEYMVGSETKYPPGPF